MQMMESLDINGDGKIDYIEFVQAAIDHQSMLNENNIQIAFNMFDINKDGKISKDELHEFFAQKITHS